MSPSHRAYPRPAAKYEGSLVVARDTTTVTSFLEDAAHYPNGHTAGVARPSSEAEVAAFVRAARRILPVGAQSSLTGGATPMGELIVATDRLDRILRVSDSEITVEAGVPLVVLRDTLARRKACYPPVPTFDGAFAGGIAATNAAGAATFKYGTTRDWVRGIKVVLADGSVLELLRGQVHAHPDGFFEFHGPDGSKRVPVPTYRMPQVPKRSAGYFAQPEMDLIDLFIGSEGTLGIITEITYAIVSPCPATCVVWLPMSDESAAFVLVETLRQETKNTWRTNDPCGIDIAAIEYLDRHSLDLARQDGIDRKHNVQIPHDSVVALLAQVELPSDTTLTAQSAYEQIGTSLLSDPPDTPLVRLCRILSHAGVLDRVELALPQNELRQQQLFAVREAVPEAVNRRVGLAKRNVSAKIKKTAADMIVPVSHFTESIKLFRKAFEQRGLDYVIWGHISDGNVHPNVIPQSNEDVQKGQEAILECGREIIQMGGCPLAEHGVGRNPVKQTLLRRLYGQTGVEQMRQVKAALDPEGKLSPGVLFPEKSVAIEQQANVERTQIRDDL